MPHRVPGLLAVGRLLRCIALCAAVACGTERRPSPQVDTTTPPRVVEVRTSPPADSALRAASATYDSLDARFVRARASLDADATLLERTSRFDSSYPRRYDAFEAKRRNAGALRDARDRARRERDALTGCSGAEITKQCADPTRR